MVDPLQVPGIGLRTTEVGAKQMRPAAVRPLEGENKSFKDVLTETLTEVERLQQEADTTIKELVSGEIKDVSEAMLAVEKADVAFQTMMTVRNKVMLAYEEIMRMQI
ncbi:MAG TPA: flagellar hook-basal body complex protein FliE [Candidatus Hydrogenedentes bacterium]|nr:flagellar hook-basal body complex protein FliE [Candidatus Hydrogenedentota bacterium]